MFKEVKTNYKTVTFAKVMDQIAWACFKSNNLYTAWIGRTEYIEEDQKHIFIPSTDIGLGEDELKDVHSFIKQLNMRELAKPEYDDCEVTVRSLGYIKR